MTQTLSRPVIIVIDQILNANLCLKNASEQSLGLLAGSSDLDNVLLIVSHVNIMLIFNLLANEVCQGIVDILSAQMGVAIDSLYCALLAYDLKD